MVEQVSGDIENLRALTADVRPAALDELGVESALEALAERVRRQGMTVDVRLDLSRGSNGSEGRLVPDVETAVYRVTQEATTNAIKHASPDHVAIEIRENAKTLHVAVHDDGRGFDPGRRAGGFGLVGMRERMDLLDGELRIESAPGARRRCMPPRRPRPRGRKRGIARAAATYNRGIQAVVARRTRLVATQGELQFGSVVGPSSR